MKAIRLKLAAKPTAFAVSELSLGNPPRVTDWSAKIKMSTTPRYRFFQ